MTWVSLKRHLLGVGILIAIGVLLPAQYSKIVSQPLYDSAQYVTMAYNMAKYNVSSISTDDTPQIQPDYFRGPAPSFLLSLPMRMMNLDRYPLSCLLEKNLPCDHVMKWERIVNALVVLLVIPGVYLATYWLTMSYGWALAAAATIATSSILASFVPVYSSELFGALFLLWHSVFFYGAVSGRHRILYAIGSGVFLTALILTKAVYLYWMFCLLIFAIVALVLPRRFDSRAVGVTLVFVLVPAIAGVGAWMVRNHAISGEFALAGRAESVMAIRAGYTTISWKQYLSGYAYFTPYVGPSLARSIFGDVAEKTYNDNVPEGLYRQMAAGVPTTSHATSKQQWHEIFGLMWTNRAMDLALIPLLSYRGMFIGGCCSKLGNTIPLYGYRGLPGGRMLWAIEAVITMMLGLAMLCLCYVLVSRRMWSLFAFVGIVLFHFLIYATATQFYSRFSVPVYPNLVVMLFLLLWLLAPAIRSRPS